MVGLVIDPLLPFPSVAAVIETEAQVRRYTGVRVDVVAAVFMCRKMQRLSRLKRELQLLHAEPPPGIMCWQHNSNVNDLRAQVVGSPGSPYEGGIFTLEILIPERYPFEPPKIHFLTPIYHPNIDTAGRICLDILKLPPKGAWRPALNISTVLTSIQLLMSEPNPDDPLMADISSEFKYNKAAFLSNARRWTEKHAAGKSQIMEEESTEEMVTTAAGTSQKRKCEEILGDPDKRLK